MSIGSDVLERVDQGADAIETMSLAEYLALCKRPNTPPPIARIPMSRDDYWALDRQPYSERFTHAEWVDGFTIVTVPTIRHQVIGLNIAMLLRAALPNALVVPGGGVKMPNSDRQPDVMVLSGYPKHERYTDTPPLIAVEVASPSTRRQDLGPKAAEYAKLGIPQYWTVDEKARSVTIRHNTGTGWEVAQVIDAEHPEADIAVPGVSQESVHVKLTDVFA